LKKIITLFADRGLVELVSRVFAVVYVFLGARAPRLASQLQSNQASGPVPRVPPRRA